MRTVLVIRHARSKANDAEVPSGMTAEDLAFADRSAGLSDEGKVQCGPLATLLEEGYGIRIGHTPAAVSTFKRTQQTANLVGFRLTQPYAVLNEVDHGMEIDELRAALRQNRIPPVALNAACAAARKLLKNPPNEDIWVTHGLLTAGLCTVLGVVDQYERPIPRQCEVRELAF